MKDLLGLSVLILGLTALGTGQQLPDEAHSTNQPSGVTNIPPPFSVNRGNFLRPRPNIRFRKNDQTRTDRLQPYVKQGKEEGREQQKQQQQQQLSTTSGLSMPAPEDDSITLNYQNESQVRQNGYLPQSSPQRRKSNTQLRFATLRRLALARLVQEGRGDPGGIIRESDEPRHTTRKGLDIMPKVQNKEPFSDVNIHVGRAGGQTWESSPHRHDQLRGSTAAGYSASRSDIFHPWDGVDGAQNGKDQLSVGGGTTIVPESDVTQFQIPINFSKDSQTYGTQNFQFDLENNSGGTRNTQPVHRFASSSQATNSKVNEELQKDAELDYNGNSQTKGRHEAEPLNSADLGTDTHLRPSATDNENESRSLHLQNLKHFEDEPGTRITNRFDRIQNTHPRVRFQLGSRKRLQLPHRRRLYRVRRPGPRNALLRRNSRMGIHRQHVRNNILNESGNTEFRPVDFHDTATQESTTLAQNNLNEQEKSVPLSPSRRGYSRGLQLAGGVRQGAEPESPTRSVFTPEDVKEDNSSNNLSGKIRLLDDLGDSEISDDLSRPDKTQSSGSAASRSLAFPFHRLIEGYPLSPRRREPSEGAQQNPSNTEEAIGSQLERQNESEIVSRQKDPLQFSSSQQTSVNQQTSRVNSQQRNTSHDFSSGISQPISGQRLLSNSRKAIQNSGVSSNRREELTEHLHNSWHPQMRDEPEDLQQSQYQQSVNNLQRLSVRQQHMINRRISQRGQQNKTQRFPQHQTEFVNQSTSQYLQQRISSPSLPQQQQQRLQQPDDQGFLSQQQQQQQQQTTNRDLLQLQNQETSKYNSQQLKPQQETESHHSSWRPQVNSGGQTVHLTQQPTDYLPGSIHPQHETLQQQLLDRHFKSPQLRDAFGPNKINNIKFSNFPQAGDITGSFNEQHQQSLPVNLPRGHTEDLHNSQVSDNSASGFTYSQQGDFQNQRSGEVNEEEKAWSSSVLLSQNQGQVNRRSQHHIGVRSNNGGQTHSSSRNTEHADSQAQFSLHVQQSLTSQVETDELPGEHAHTSQSSSSTSDDFDSSSFRDTRISPADTDQHSQLSDGREVNLASNTSPYNSNGFTESQNTLGPVEHSSDNAVKSYSSEVNIPASELEDSNPRKTNNISNSSESSIDREVYSQTRVDDMGNSGLHTDTVSPNNVHQLISINGNHSLGSTVNSQYHQGSQSNAYSASGVESSVFRDSTHTGSHKKDDSLHQNYEPTAGVKQTAEQESRISGRQRPYHRGGQKPDTRDELFLETKNEKLSFNTDQDLSFISRQNSEQETGFTGSQVSRFKGIESALRGSQFSDPRSRGSGERRKVYRKEQSSFRSDHNSQEEGQQGLKLSLHQGLGYLGEQVTDPDTDGRLGVRNDFTRIQLSPLRISHVAGNRRDQLSEFEVEETFDHWGHNLPDEQPEDVEPSHYQDENSERFRNQILYVEAGPDLSTQHGTSAQILKDQRNVQSETQPSPRNHLPGYSRRVTNSHGRPGYSYQRGPTAVSTLQRQRDNHSTTHSTFRSPIRGNTQSDSGPINVSESAYMSLYSSDTVPGYQDVVDVPKSKFRQPSSTAEGQHSQGPYRPTSERGNRKFLDTLRGVDTNVQEEKLLKNIAALLRGEDISTPRVTSSELQTVSSSDTLTEIPVTGFRCESHVTGYYADTHEDSKCQSFHFCAADGSKTSYLCPTGTVFNQRLLVCDHVFRVRCSRSANFYHLNERLYDADHHQQVMNGSRAFRTFGRRVQDSSYLPSEPTEPQSFQ
ncbi:uncharacterized protein LOC121862396 [Homarus americanus]|uniref:uncharacterized protein LOC121862396 n=1 Tax=Homarus americanus TaxID=6706 RepID=UPI001C4739BD|nr:uncharacterized protein LOC121862396 [Homarus americanus]